VPATSSCNFDTNKQVAVEYQKINVNTKKPLFGREIPYGRVWAPGGKPMTLFANTPITIGNTHVPVGAYTMYVVPEEKQWILVISKSTDASGKYDKSKDLARVPMQYGELGSPEAEFSVYFAHEAPKQCSMRLDLDQSRAWVELQEQ
jgi:hypothetical protein